MSEPALDAVYERAQTARKRVLRWLTDDWQNPPADEDSVAAMIALDEMLKRGEVEADQRWRVRRFPQGEDHQAPCATCGSRCLAENCDRYVPAPVSGTEPDTAKPWRVTASMPQDVYAVLKPLILLLGGQVESAGEGGWLGKGTEQAEPSAGFSVDAGKATDGND